MANHAQAQVFQDTRRKWNDRQKDGRRRDTPYDLDIMTKILRRLYNPTLQGERYFYSKDEEGVSVAKILTTVVTPHHACRLELSNTLNAADWSTTPMPTDYIGNIWPPSTVADLLGHPSSREWCQKCSKEGQTCNCNYAAWVHRQELECHVHSRLRRLNDNRGHGVFACQDLVHPAWIREFTGLIKPVGGPTSPGEDSYQAEIDIGGYHSGNMTKAFIVPLRAGGITRSNNHTCDPNAEFINFRSGMQHRILMVGTRRTVNWGEDITLDYDSGWFNGPGHYCECGSENCKNPKLEEDEEMEENVEDDMESDDELDLEDPSKEEGDAMEVEQEEGDPSEDEDDTTEVDNDGDPATRRGRKFPPNARYQEHY